MLAIALVPSILLLLIGVGTAIPLINEGRHAEDFARTLSTNIGPIREYLHAVEEERLRSVWRLAGESSDPQELAMARSRFDKALDQMAQFAATYRSMGDNTVTNTVDAFNQLKTQLPVLRSAIDTGTLPLADAYSFYNRLVEGVDKGLTIDEDNAPDVQSLVGLTRNVRLLYVVEAMSRATALSAAAASPAGLSAELAREYRDLVGYYHTEFAKLSGELDPANAQRAKDILTGPLWQRVTAVEDAIVTPAPADAKGSRTDAAPRLPITISEWHDAATQLGAQLVSLWADQTTLAQQHAADTGSERARTSLWRAAAVIAAVIAAFVLSVVLANRLIGRLRRLRSETLALAEVRLPETMRRLNDGAVIDVETEAARLDFGRDEIGQVAQAFNRAHTAAVSAAVTESRTREGVRAVFLNIAHRSQMVVHQQLAILDQAEQSQEDPTLLETFFRLDHLATRERRNAENLIILGGGRPGRQWRRPVPLIELVRSAVGETLDYTRVNTGAMPDAHILGSAVADLIHLLAELTDNATSFSPPQTRVSVTGAAVGKGVAVEITDQGMGIPAPELDRLNELLSSPPDFGLVALSENSRLGLFVVARLAARHEIAVRLSDSDYGGVRAIVLIPTALIAAEPAAIDHVPNYLTGRRADPPLTGEFAAIHIDETPAAPTPALSPARPEPARSGETFEGRALGHESRPALPKRDRQSSLAPELASAAPEIAPDPHPPRGRSAEQARNLMSAIENGTRQGRRTAPDHFPTGRHESAPRGNEQDDDGDRFRHR